MSDATRSTHGKPSVDFRSPQEKGKPAHSALHSQVGQDAASGPPAQVPNRSGAVRMNW